MAFIPDNISVHVHLLEDNDQIKKQILLLLAGFFCLADFPQIQQECFSVSILSAEKSQSIQLPTFSSCGAHIRSGDNIFSVQIATTTVCMQWSTRVFVNHSKDAFVKTFFSRFLGRLLDFSSV